MNSRVFLLLAALAAWAALSAPARAAESYGNCKGFIDSLPATIGTQGVWCLRKDLSTSQTWGAAITIAANNVTIDCNDYKVGGLSAGPDTETVGIQVAAERLNAVVRGCNLRGFLVGVYVQGAGSLIENNRIDGSTAIGIQSLGDGAVIRGNQVTGTGNRVLPAVGIRAYYGARVLDNDIHGVVQVYDGVEGGYGATGIEISNGFALDNRVTGLEITSAPYYADVRTAGIHLSSSVAEGNALVADAFGNSFGIVGNSEAASVCRGNMIAKFHTGTQDCAASGNVFAPDGVELP